ncbi:MAG: chorismate mutase [Rhodobacteraceae bacterium]|nr:chorismate mutase [Paracoccaceae bacterium]MBR9823572.1 chorismate mutase [Paracoccaceae bacterium]
MHRSPLACETMAELRLEIDSIDDALIALLVRRAGYVDRAATLKHREGLPPRTSARVEEVIAHVRSRAAAQGLDPDLTETLWTALIDWGIAREARSMGVAEDATPREP